MQLVLCGNFYGLTIQNTVTVSISLLWFMIVYFAMQEEKFIKYVDGLRLMLDRYHSVLGSLNVAEVSF